MHLNNKISKFLFNFFFKKKILMWAGPQAHGQTLIRGGLQKSAHRFYAERANPTRFLPALPLLIFIAYGFVM